MNACSFVSFGKPFRISMHLVTDFSDHPIPQSGTTRDHPIVLKLADYRTLRIQSSNKRL